MAGPSAASSALFSACRALSSFRILRLDNLSSNKGAFKKVSPPLRYSLTHSLPYIVSLLCHFIPFHSTPLLLSLPLSLTATSPLLHCHLITALLHFPTPTVTVVTIATVSDVVTTLVISLSSFLDPISCLTQILFSCRL
jgi:hypothetical protein